MAGNVTLNERLKTALKSNNLVNFSSFFSEMLKLELEELINRSEHLQSITELSELINELDNHDFLVIDDLCAMGCNLILSRVGAGKSWNKEKITNECNFRIKAFLNGKWLPDNKLKMQAKISALKATGLSDEQINTILAVLSN